jgi:hypothetical protein
VTDSAQKPEQSGITIPTPDFYVRGITPANHRYSPRRHDQGNLTNQNGELPRSGRGSGMFWKLVNVILRFVTSVKCARE